MGYSVDLDAISIAEYKAKLEEKTLIPSQRILIEDIDERFAALRAAGIGSAGELLAALEKKDGLKELSKRTGVGEEYLKTLRRELRGRQSKPRKLADFTWISKGTITNLQRDGIKTTKQLHDLVLSRKSRKELADRLELKDETLLALTKQADLTRIQWVNATFARVLYEAGFDTPAKVQRADAGTLYEKVLAVNDAQGLYRGNIGLNDMKICIEAAREVDLDVRY